MWPNSHIKLLFALALVNSNSLSHRLSCQYGLNAQKVLRWDATSYKPTIGILRTKGASNRGGRPTSSPSHKHFNILEDTWPNPYLKVLSILTHLDIWLYEFVFTNSKPKKHLQIKGVICHFISQGPTTKNHSLLQKQCLSSSLTSTTRQANTMKLCSLIAHRTLD